ncbi:MAG TPA: DUF2846 domain-containing protein [Pseudomonas sp.]|nr:DUF2846 domain-containing protein [Pseudomonas sp.]
MHKKFAVLGLSVALLQGCASVNMESDQASYKASNFSEPSPGFANLYIYRSTSVGQGLKKDVWLNNDCVGETANNVFFLKEVIGEGAEHKVSTESEFSPNHMLFNAESGKNYYVEQYIKMGVFVGGANLRLVDETKAKQQIAKLKLATKGKCSKPHP